MENSYCFLGYGNPYMVPGVPPGATMPPQFNGYYPTPHQMPPQQPAPNGAPPMMGYPTPPQGENGQMYASSAPPPPTPPLHESTQQPTHFTSPPQTRYVIHNISLSENVKIFLPEWKIRIFTFWSKSLRKQHFDFYKRICKEMISRNIFWRE